LTVLKGFKHSLKVLLIKNALERSKKYAERLEAGKVFARTRAVTEKTFPVLHYHFKKKYGSRLPFNFNVLKIRKETHYLKLRVRDSIYGTISKKIHFF
jgi:hypothetical protein